MNPNSRFSIPAGILSGLLLLGLWPVHGLAQSTDQGGTAGEKTAQSVTGAAAEDSVIKLSPFAVTTDKDKGYRATNTTSGTRLNTPIKDLPMPIEVITEAFMKDIGAKDLRQALRYSAGIQIQTQNDWGVPQGWAAATPGRINNPESSTATADQSHVKIRGFLTDATLRDGFRRQNSTDSVNLARVEVIRGPSALLYGVGNFGGVVNYLVKQPGTTADGEYTVETGSDGLKRGTLDYTAPISRTVAYRVTGAYQDTEDHTDYARENHFFVSPIVTWKPFAGTEISFDTEYGKQNRQGTGFQDLRAVQSPFVNNEAGYNGGFLPIPGRDTKRFRWSGPDAFNNSEAYNFLVKLDQKITEDLHLVVGYNSAGFSYDQLDVAAALEQPNATSTPRWAIGSVTYVPLLPGQSGIPTGPQAATIGYQWNKSAEHDRHNQLRADLTYTLGLFRDSKWLKMDNMFLAGLNYTNERHENSVNGTVYDRNNFKNPNDFTPFRYGVQADGTPDAEMLDLFHTKDITQDAASYAVYQGKLLDGWATLIAGVRRDRSWNKNWHYSPQWGAGMATHNGGGADRAPGAVYGAPSKDTTHQYGLDVRLVRDGSLSLFVMSSEASLPNYSGIKDYNGNLLQASLAKDREYGLKFDLLEGRISGTISKFEITRTRVGVGNPGGTWWAPTFTGSSAFQPDKSIVYQINDLNPYSASAQITRTPLATASVRNAWDAAVVAGKVYQAKNSAGATNWYVDAGSGSGKGADYLDAVFNQIAAQGFTGYWGWIYNTDNLTNETKVDYNGGNPPGPTGGQSVSLGSDRSSGWDAQVLLSPTDNLQIALSYSHITKKVLKASGWIRYPYPQDRWSIWYAPIFFADGTTPASARFGDVNDTSTHKSFGDGLALDDTPTSQASAWINYQMPKDGPMHGLVLGVGATYQGTGSIYPTYFSQPKDANGNTLFLNTRSKTLYNGMVRYEFKMRGHEASLQMNIDNLANNTDYYGLIANPPRKWSLTYAQKL